MWGSRTRSFGRSVVFSSEVAGDEFFVRVSWFLWFLFARSWVLVMYSFCVGEYKRFTGFLYVLFFFELSRGTCFNVKVIGLFVFEVVWEKSSVSFGRWGY